MPVSCKPLSTEIGFGGLTQGPAASLLGRKTNSSEHEHHRRPLSMPGHLSLNPIKGPNWVGMQRSHGEARIAAEVLLTSGLGTSNHTALLLFRITMGD